MKSVNLDTWTPEQVVSLQNMGNSRARAVYEAQLPDGYLRPTTDSSLESFIRAKYEHKKYIAREYVPSTPSKVNWDKEIDDEIEKQKRKKKSSSSSMVFSAPVSAAIVKSQIPAPLPKPKLTCSSPKTGHFTSVTDSSSCSSDLLGLSLPIAQNGPNKNSSALSDLSGSNDVFSSFVSAPTKTTSATIKPLTNENIASAISDCNSNGKNVQNTTSNLLKEEEDFFNQIPSEGEKAKLTKDSILALYGTIPTAQAGHFNNSNIGGFHQYSNHAGFGAQPQIVGNMFGGIQFNQQSIQANNSNNIVSQQVLSGLGGFSSQQQQHNQPTFAQFPQNPLVATAAFPSQQAFAQPSQPSTNINQQFGNLNLRNVWQ